MRECGGGNFQLKIENLKFLQSHSYLVGGEAMDADHFGPRGLTADDAERAVRDAHARLRFTIDLEVPVIESKNG